jgi:hypothetical protein
MWSRQFTERVDADRFGSTARDSWALHSLHGMEPPVACSLDATGARSQLDEWRDLLRSMVVSIEWAQPTCLRMGLQADHVSTAALVALATREVECCPFFRFAIEVDARRLAFTVSVPPEGAAILQDFAQLVER